MLTQATDLGDALTYQRENQSHHRLLNLFKAGREIFFGYVSVDLPQLEPVMQALHKQFLSCREGVAGMRGHGLEGIEPTPSRTRDADRTCRSYRDCRSLVRRGQVGRELAMRQSGGDTRLINGK
ncbi:hypothetical protein A7U43_21675 [Mycobacterium adipatum]|uniref:Uncharacterized protein n=1 Tax=Mycobacterium adipatum TaxID=1682113 RepID=A0A172UQU7_9MYCO|nr:hypothetical protein A7U43_21675 [Mycobacterium adipatum]